MKKRTTAQALFLSVISLLLCVSMLIGTTFAWFTDSVSSARNTIQSGNLDVELYFADSAAKVAADDWTPVTDSTDIFSHDKWEPGYTKVAYFKVVNNGSLALNYQLNADVYAETAGKNKANETFLLSDYIKTSVVETDDTRDDILALTGKDLKGSIGMKENMYLLPGEKDIVGFALWMPTTVTNEANHNGTDIPSIEFGINLIATQAVKEADSFDSSYDNNSTMPSSGTGSVAVVENQTEDYVIPVKNAGGNSVGTVTVDPESVADDALNLNVSIVAKDAVDPSVTTQITSDQAATTYEISVDGLKDDNTEPVEVVFYIGKGLTNVALYHKDTPIVCDYDAETGKITFNSASFSPFTVVYDAVAEVLPPVESDLPVAVAELSLQYVNTELPWGSYGQWSPDSTVDANPMLEAAYTFTAQDTVTEAQQSPYADWYCDFYVKLDRDLGENQIFLGGHYGSFGWVGFHNGDVTLKANEELPLLGSVAQSPWTYLDVVQNVGEFICGVGDVNNALEGATFTVMLRLTNPEDETEFYDVETINHTFGTTYVTTGEEIQEAVDNGSTHITLGDDIDLSEGLVIPGLE